MTTNQISNPVSARTEQKKCSKCGMMKPLSAFSKNKNSKDGLRPDCKDCVSIYNKNYIKNHSRNTAINVVKPLSRFATIKDVAIIPSQIGGSEIQTVNARDLHEFLEVRTPFSMWVDRRITDYGFIQDIDFVHVSQKSETSTGATIKHEYHISLSMAKELCMVERNDKGKDARLYYIECEKRYKELADKPMSALDILAQQIAIMQRQEKKMLAVKQTQDKQTETLVKHEEKLHEIESKVITTNSDFYTISGFANLRGYKIDVRQAAVLGKLSSKLSRDYDYHIGSVKDERYGSVNTYHSDILSEAFEKALTGK
jgi:phage anti-repressor protein